MTFLPIVARELRVTARRRGTYWMRTAAALIVILAGTWMFIMMHDNPPGDIAKVLFGVLTACAVLYSLLSGVRSTADCLSEEKREGTLGLLFLTDLKGYDVVLGKLAANSLNAFYSVLAVVPMLAIPLLLGGVTAGEFGRMALVVVNALFFSLAIGIGISAMCRSAQKAMGMTLLLVLFFTAILPAAGAGLVAFGKTPRLEPVFVIASAGFSYYMAWDIPFRTRPDAFWYSMLVIHTLGWLALALASIIVPRAWQDKPAGAQALRWRERWQLWSFGNLAERAAFRRLLLDQNPFYWLAARARLKPACVWAALGLLACVWAWGVAKFHRDWLNVGIYVATMATLNLMLRSWFASEAPRQLAEDRKAGTLELLLSTPITVREILRGQWLALQRQFVGPVLVVLAVECLFMAAGLSDLTADNERGLWIFFCLAYMVMLVADLAALYWVGMWQGLTAKNAQRAANASMARVLVMPWAVYALVMLMMVLVSMANTRPPEPGPWFFLALWFILGIGVDLGFGAVARHKLLTEFRLAAERRYASPLKFWKRLFGEPQAEQTHLPPVVAIRDS